MNFGQALEEVKQGNKIARSGWNGKGMFVYYVPAARYEACTEIGESIADEENKVSYEPYLAIKNVKGTVSTWVPSINDCLAEDWVVVGGLSSNHVIGELKLQANVDMSEVDTAIDKAKELKEIVENLHINIDVVRN